MSSADWLDKPSRARCICWVSGQGRRAKVAIRIRGGSPPQQGHAPMTFSRWRHARQKHKPIHGTYENATKNVLMADDRSLIVANPLGIA